MRVSKKAKSQVQKKAVRRGRPPLSAAEKARRLEERLAAKGSPKASKAKRAAKAPKAIRQSRKPSILSAVEANPKSIDLALMLVDFSNRIGTLEKQIVEYSAAFQELQINLVEANKAWTEHHTVALNESLERICERINAIEARMMTSSEKKRVASVVSLAASNQKVTDEKESCCKEGNEGCCKEETAPSESAGNEQTSIL